MPEPIARAASRRGRVLALARLFTLAILMLALFPCVVALVAGVSLRQTVANPAYIMDVVRSNQVLELTKAEFLDGLVQGSGLDTPEQTALRQALEEGVPVSWLDSQLRNILTAVTSYLGSSQAPQLSIELSVVELKVSLLAAIREHMGEEWYLQAALGLQAVPDFVDLGEGLDTSALTRARPFWRAAVAAPWMAGGGCLVLSLLVWLIGGRGAKGVALAGGVWAAAGLVVALLAGVLGVAASTRIAGVLPLNLPELQSVSLHQLAVSALDGVRSQLLATGTGAAFAGLAALSLPWVGRGRRRAGLHRRKPA